MCCGILCLFYFSPVCVRTSITNSKLHCVLCNLLISDQCVCIPQEPTVSSINSSTCAVEYSVSLISDQCVCVPEEPTVSYINSSTCAVEYSVSLISDQCVCVPQEPTVSYINSSACAVEYSVSLISDQGSRVRVRVCAYLKNQQ